MVVNRVFIHRTGSGRSAAWLARLPWEQEVGGSNPLAPTICSNFKELVFLASRFFSVVSPPRARYQNSLPEKE